MRGSQPIPLRTTRGYLTNGAEFFFTRREKRKAVFKDTPFRAIVSPLVVRQVLAQSMVRKG